LGVRVRQGCALLADTGEFITTNWMGVDSVAIGRLDLTAKLHQPGIYDVVTKVAQDERSKAPVVVDLDPTSFCDLACPECISGKLLNQGRFTRERLGSLAEELVSMGSRRSS
jgi:hypothetical protein